MMTEIEFSNTTIGIHIRAKELKIKAYNLGCSCYDCCKEFDEMLKEIEIHEPHDKHVKAYDINHFKNRKRTKPVTTLKGLKMKDDSLSDTQKDGGYCSKCDTVWVAPGKCNCSVGIKKEFSPNKETNVYATRIWNEAIEAAALEIEKSLDANCYKASIIISEAQDIRKLKK